MPVSRHESACPYWPAVFSDNSETKMAVAEKIFGDSLRVKSRKKLDLCY